MKLAILLLATVSSSCFLTGCGDPAPSTPVAPEVKMPDTSKMSTDEMMKLKNAGGEADSRPVAGGK